MTPGVLIAFVNQFVLDALRRAGVPLGTAQQIILAADWRKSLKEAVKKLLKGKTE